MPNRLLRKDYLWVTGVMFFLTALMTFPLIFRLFRCIPGFLSTDEPYGLLWYWWWLKFSLLNHLNPFHTSFLAAPQGIAMPLSIYPLWTLFNFAVNFLTNESFTYNLQVIASFLLSGYFMYRLAHYITRNKPAALLAGIFYAFCPYHFIRSWQHLGLAQIQFIPLYLLLLLRLRDDPCRKNLLLASLGLFLVSCFDFYYFYFMVICTLFFLLFIVLRDTRALKWKAGGYVLLALFLGGLVSCLPLLPSRKTVITGYRQDKTSAWSMKKPFDDLFAQSARPLSYFLPATVHPVFGGFTENFAGTSLYGISLTEHTLYLGWIPLILAIFAIKKRKKLSCAGSGAQGADNFHPRFFIFLALIAWLFSQPPWWEIGPLKILMPSFFMYKIFPMFRAYCRFGIVVMLAVAALAAYAVPLILGRLRSYRTRIILVVLIAAFSLFEFWSWPPQKIIDTSQVPEVYYWLKSKPSGVVIAEYPLDLDSPGELYKFYQTVHNKKMINASVPGSPVNLRARKIVNLSEPQTAQILRQMGVKYVLVHFDGYLGSGLLQDQQELERIRGNPELSFVQKFAPESCSTEESMCTRRSSEIEVWEIKDRRQQKK